MADDAQRGSSNGHADARESAPAAPVSDRRQRRRAPTQWDVKPVGFVEGTSIATSTTSVAPAMSGLPVLGIRAAPSQQTRNARRLYVGGLGEVPEKEIEVFFADLVKRAVIDKEALPENPILSVYLNPERKFAFVEFCSIELANSFLDLDGLIFRDHPVKIRRPGDYAPHAVPEELRDRKEPLDYSVIPLGSNAPALALIGRAGGASSAGNRIYLGNIPTALTEAQLYELVSAFGPLRKLDYVKTPDGLPKGYAFIEFVDPVVTDTAIAGLNNLPLGDRTLTASRAKTGADAAFASAVPAAQAAASKVVCLDSMVTPEELVDDAEYRDIVDDISNECRRYGELTGVIVPRPGTSGVGRVFLTYADTAAAGNAIRALEGRQFAGRSIRARYYDEAALAASQYTL